MEWESLLWVSALGAFASLDVTAVGQFLLSRPLFVAPVTGWLLQDVKTGILVGSLVELLWLHALPVGVAMPLDVCAISLLVTVWCAVVGSSPAMVVLSLLLAIPWAVLFRKTDIFLRQKIVAINHHLDTEAAGGSSVPVGRWMALGLGVMFLRSFFFYALAAGTGIFLMPWASRAVPPLVLEGMAQSLPLLVVLGLAVAMHAFYEKG